MLNEQQFYLYGQIQTSQTGIQVCVQWHFPLCYQIMSDDGNTAKEGDLKIEQKRFVKHWPHL